MTYTGGSEMKAWHEQPFCYANGPVVCSFNAWPITAEAHDWGDWCALRDSLSITHLLPTSFHLHFRLVKNEIYTLLILQAGVRGKSDITGCCGLGLRKAMIRAKRMHSTRNCPLVRPMEENVIQPKKIQSSRHQHCTSAQRITRNFQWKKTLAVAMVDSQWPLAPDASAQHKFLPFARYMFNPKPRIEAPKVLKQLWTTAYRLYNVLRLAIHNRCASRQPRRKEGWEANCGLSLTKPTAVHVGVVKNVKMRQGHQQGWSFLVLRHFWHC